MISYVRILKLAVLALSLFFVSACFRSNAQESPSPDLATESLSEDSQGPQAVDESSSPIPVITETLETTEPSEIAQPFELTQRHPDENALADYLTDQNSGPFSSIETILFADVSGDGEEDLIAISDQEPIFILIWDGQQYDSPQETGYWPEGRFEADGRHTYLKDYTGDRVPEIVSDVWVTRGEDDYSAIDWTRQITFCEQDSCRVIWQDWFAAYGDAPTSTGMFYYNSSDYVYRNDVGDLILERLYFGLSLFWPYTGPPNEPQLHPEQNAAVLGLDTGEKLYVDVDLLRRYIWDGQAYVFLEDEILEPLQLIERDATHQATGPDGTLALVRFELDETSQTYRNDRCQVFVDGEPASLPFGCKDEFTTIEWRNVVGDNKPELVMETISGDQSSMWLDLVAEKGCFHKRIQVYTWDGSFADQVANIVGCVRRSDLFGAHLRDYDEDGQLEILAATDWPQFLEPEQPDGFSQDYMQFNQLVEIYEWNGQLFVVGWTLGN